jgi:SAM-dependent methyltransferase
MRLAAYDQCDSSPAEARAVVWEECACLLCGSGAWSPLLEAADPIEQHGGLRFLVVRCQHCGLCFTNPRPNVQCIRHFYPVDYHRQHGKQRGTKDRLWRADPMRKLLPIQGKVRLLDFGCGAGDFLQRMHLLGWNVLGLDAAQTAVGIVRWQRGLPAHVGTLPQPLWADASFEAITMWQTLEHVHQPLDALRDAYRLLTPQGRLLVTVPNLESLSSSWFGSNWYGLDLPRHLTHFTTETLRGMLQRAGFEKIAIYHQQHGSWIRHSARLAHARRDGSLASWCLRSRLGSGLASWLGRWRGKAESLCAIADKS